MTAVMEQVRMRDIEVAPGVRVAMEVVRGGWSARDRAALYVPQKIKPSAWAEKYRHLVKTALPGPWRNDHAPYLRGIMDLANAPGVEELVIQKAAQMGVSEALRTLMGCWAHLDPEPMGLALPSKEKGREIIENEILPFFQREFARVPELRALLSPRLHDMKKGQIKLGNGFLMHLMWSGSPSSMASNPMKRALSDEADKFPPWAGNDADPLSLIGMRLRTYPDRIHVIDSTPTTNLGAIARRLLQAHYLLYYLVACPHCGLRQRLLFGEGGDYGVKWSKGVRELYKAGKNEAAAALVLAEGVFYQCAGCQGRIDEREKRAMVREGKWGTSADGVRGDNDECRTMNDENMPTGVPEGMAPVQSGVITDAEAVKVWPRGTKLGLQISSLYCCWENWTMAHVAAQFLAARSLSDRFAFRTSTLGEVWEESLGQATETIEIDERVKESKLAEGVCPRWTARLIAAVDTQKDHFWMVIRAWGPGMRSARVWHGKVASFEEVEQWCWKTPWKNEDGRLAARICDKVLIDSGGTRKWEEEERADKPLPSRVMDVYAWGLEHQSRVNVIKGDNRPLAGQYIRRGKGEYVTDREKRPVLLSLLDVHHFQDQLAELMGQKLALVDMKTGEVTGQEPAWSLNGRDDPEYARHMAAMHKIQRRAGSGGMRGALEFAWVPKRDGLRTDYRDIEGYQVAGAFMTGVHLLPELEVYMASVEAELAQKQEARSQKSEESRFTSADGRAFLATQRGNG